MQSHSSRLPWAEGGGPPLPKITSRDLFSVEMPGISAEDLARSFVKVGEPFRRYVSEEDPVFIHRLDEESRVLYGLPWDPPPPTAAEVVLRGRRERRKL